MLRIRITLIRIWIRIFYAMHIFSLRCGSRFDILIVNPDPQKIDAILQQWPTDPSRLHEPPSLHCEPPRLHCEPSRLHCKSQLLYVQCGYWIRYQLIRLPTFRLNNSQHC